MRVDVVMPQMGESIAEGTISRWLKRVGDVVKRDEPLLEISTDKVDAEVPSPAEGRLVEIRYREGDTVPVNTPIAVIETEVAEAAGAGAAGPAPPEGRARPEPGESPEVAAGERGGTTRVDVVMPQMGESIAEGTISRWLKRVGDVVKRDEPLLEISTDKVDAEVPSPAEGRLVEIRYREGDTVPVNTPIAVIEALAGVPQAGQREVVRREPSDGGARRVARPAAGPTGPVSAPFGAIESPEERRRRLSSPFVRRLAKEHGIDLTEISGTGLSGRVTKKDILAAIQSRRAAAARRPEAAPPPPVAPAAPIPTPAEIPAYEPGEPVEIVPMTPMRKTIAERMILSRRTSAHVTTVFEVDMTRVMRRRDALKDEFLNRHGVRLTPLAFVAQACIDALKKFPIFNASISGDNIVYKKNINLGIAVALDWGLIVPVIKQADEKSLLGLAKAIQDLADRARRKELKPEEVKGGTFTITNPGIFGSLFGTPIINQPQVAILGVGSIHKRPVVIEGDAIAVRSMAYLSLSFDHRLIDGALGDQFMAHIKRWLESLDVE